MVCLPGRFTLQRQHWICSPSQRGSLAYIKPHNLPRGRAFSSVVCSIKEIHSWLYIDVSVTEKFWKRSMKGRNSPGTNGQRMLAGLTLWVVWVTRLPLHEAVCMVIPWPTLPSHWLLKACQSLRRHGIPPDRALKWNLRKGKGLSHLYDNPQS